MPLPILSAGPVINWSLIRLSYRKVVDDCKWVAPYALLMEVTGYTLWKLGERLKLRDAVKKKNPECKIVLVVDENAEKEVAKQVKQAKKDGLID